MDLPDPARAWDYENSFWLTAGASRLSKVLAHYELYKRVTTLPGAIVECGVFKGASLSRFAMMRSLFSTSEAREIIGFDTFTRFPDTEFTDDIPARATFVAAAGDECVSADDLTSLLENRGLGSHVQLVPGDITETVPAFVKEHPALRVALLNIDTDIYEPAVTTFDYLYERVVPGGIVILDDYGVFPGETLAAEEFLSDLDIKIERFAWAPSPCFFCKP